MAAKKSAKKARRPARVWMLVPTAADVEVLRSRISARGPLWDRWRYKLHRDRITIYDLMLPLAGEPVPAEPEYRPHLRVGPYPGGPFELEWMRHTGRWFPLYVTGTIEQIADALAGGNVPMTQPMDQVQHERQPKG